MEAIKQQNIVTIQRKL